MQATATIQRQDAAAYLSRRVYGDLRALNRYYGFRSDAALGDLIADLELGLAHRGIESVAFYLYPDGDAQPQEVYRYSVTSAGDLEASATSGRMTYDARLEGCSFKPIVTPSDRAIWDNLKRRGLMQVSWSPCQSPDTSMMAEAADGGYVSGDQGLRRTKLTRL